MNRKILFLILFTFFSIGFCQGQSKKKLSKDEKAKMTQDQRIAYENDRVGKKKRKNESVKDKAKRAKKIDKSSRKMKPKQKKRKSNP